MTNQYLHSVRQWYRTTDWNAALATAAVAWVFAAMGGALSMNLRADQFIRTGTVSSSQSWPFAVIFGIVTATAVVPLLHGARVLLGRVGKRETYGLSAAVVLLAGLSLSTVLFLASATTAGTFNESSLSHFANDEIVAGTVWWTPPLLLASVGLWLRDHRSNLSSGTTLGAFVAVAVVVLVTGVAGGMVLPAEEETTNYSWEENPQNASLYVDGETGPYERTSLTQTEPAPLSGTEFSCSEAVTLPDSFPADEYSVEEDVSVNTFEFDSGESVPNRVTVSLPVPRNATLVRTMSGPVDNYTREATAGVIDGDVTIRFLSTEWTQPGFVSATVVTENHTAERYWAPVCPSEGVG